VSVEGVAVGTEFGAVSCTVVAGGCAGAGVGLVIGVCGSPEPDLGVAGLDWAQQDVADIATNRSASEAIGERCIES
jgi:hypothetical protein